MQARWLVGAVAGLMAVGQLGGAARADTRVASYATWLRAAPAERGAVLDEVLGGWPVEVESCEAGWCRVIAARAVGYMRQDMLAAAPRPLPTPKPGGGCVPAEHFTPEGPLPLRLCEGVPAAR